MRIYPPLFSQEQWNSSSTSTKSKCRKIRKSLAVRGGGGKRPRERERAAQLFVQESQCGIARHLEETVCCASGSSFLFFLLSFFLPSKSG